MVSNNVVNIPNVNRNGNSFNITRMKHVIFIKKRMNIKRGFAEGVIKSRSVTSFKILTRCVEKKISIT